MLETPQRDRMTDYDFSGPIPAFRVGALESVRRHKLLAALPLIFLAVFAVAYGMRRDPTYTAEARVGVGGLDLAQPGALNGFSDATETLAATYSRVITADDVIEPLAKDLHITPSAARGRISASPVPGSSIIRVSATGLSAGAAVTTANAASEELESYVSGISRVDTTSRRVYEAYRRAVRNQQARQLRVDRLNRNAGDNPAVEVRTQLVQARTELNLSTLRTQLLRQRYRSLQQSEASSPELQTLTKASFATSDRSSNLQLVLFGALAVGALLGIALATLRANALARRSVGVR